MSIHILLLLLGLSGTKLSQESIVGQRGVETILEIKFISSKK